MRRKVIYSVLWLFAFVTASAQQVSNADYYEKDRKLYVTYSLDKIANINLFVSINGGTYRLVDDTNLSGDVGKNVKAGSKKTIVWDVLREREELIGEVAFKVVAEQSSREMEKAKVAESKKTNSSSGYASLRERFYENAGSFDLALAELGVGVSLNNPVGIPLTLSALTFRYKMVEIVPASFTYNLMGLKENPRSGMYWKPQARVVFPIGKKFALVPSIGPSLDLFNPKWWLIATLHLRCLYSSTSGSYLDLYVGYEDEGYTVGLTYTYSIDF